MEQSMLHKFLHFCTGTDVIVVEKISVAFISFEREKTRRPIAHTCAPLLELPNSYRTYCELREEFNNILSLPGWAMDMI